MFLNHLIEKHSDDGETGKLKKLESLKGQMKKTVNDVREISQSTGMNLTDVDLYVIAEIQKSF